MIDTRNLPCPSTWELPEGLEDLGPTATVSAVGRSVVTNPQLIEAACAALAGHGMLTWWAAGDRFTAEVERGSLLQAQDVLHRALIG